MDRGENERVWDRTKKNWEGNMEKRNHEKREEECREELREWYSMIEKRKERERGGGERERE